MKIRKISKGAGVLLIAAVLLFSSVAVMADTVEEQNVDPRFIKATGPNYINGDEVQSPIGDVLYSQLPYEPYEAWIFMTSAAQPGYRVHDNYFDVTEEICDIHWWGLSLVYSGGWVNCDPEGMCFQIIFWDSLLGTPICTYNNVCPIAVPTGKFYNIYEMYYWEAVLDPCCDLFPEGWVSIQSYSSANNCWFLWAGSDDGDHYSYQEGSPDPEDFINDTAFELTPQGPPPVPKICCTGVGMAFGEVDPKTSLNVSGQIKICNCGDPMSFLNWEVDTTNVPTWGTWKFTPDSGTDLLEPNCAVVDVACQVTGTAGDYTGVIKVYNKDDPSNFCEVSTSVSVIKPRARTGYNPFFLNLLQQFPALYLIIKMIFRA
jgi:hypothetical protein